MNTTIKTVSGDVYRYDEEAGEVYKNEVVISGAEPVYTEGNPPKFAGIYLRNGNQILSLSGKMHSLSNERDE